MEQKESKSTNKEENMRARGHNNAHHFLSNPVAGLYRAYIHFWYLMV